MYSETLRRRLDRIGGTPTTVTPEMEAAGAAAFGSQKTPESPPAPLPAPDVPASGQSERYLGPKPPEPTAPPPLPGFNGFGDAKPSTNVADVVAEIVGEDSPLMQRARTEGTQIGNRRGVMNSSVTAGASMNAILDRAIPMAQQTAQQRFQADQAKERFGEAQAMSAQEFEQSGALSEQQSLQQMEQAAQAFGYGQQLSEQESLQRITETRSQFQEQGLLSAQEFQQQGQLSEQEFQQQTGMSRQAYQQDLALQERRIGSEYELALLDAESRSALLEQERAMRESIASIEIGAEDRQTMMSMITNMNEVYSEEMRAILANPDMSAADRNALLRAELAGPVHALSLRALTPAEAAASTT